ncbi:MAG: DUF2723 domain-containing protein [Bacteroidales bacterium]|nr:DUF2723 domain-containing protein [Bacteroidales bacterium]
MVARFKHLNNLFGWLAAMVGTIVYVLTLEPTVSFWDCGEFISTSYKLEVGHPPGAPLYQLLAHCFTLLAGGNVTMIAWWSNLLSAIAGGLTVMFLFWTQVRLMRVMMPVCDSDSSEYQNYKIWFCAAVGSACYLFCDTAWFSAVESEVYSLSMLFSSAIVWSMMRWAQCEDRAYSGRWLLLAVFLTSLSIGVHQLSLLTVPASILIVIFKIHPRRSGRGDKSKCRRPVIAALHDKNSRRSIIRLAALSLLMFFVGISTYAIIPIRAAANPPINDGDPSSWHSFKVYVNRDQYEKAPLIYGRCFNSPIVEFKNGEPVYAKEMDMFFPRMWKAHEHAEEYYDQWTGHNGKMVAVGDTEYYKPSFLDNIIVFGAYQFGYMYLRYLMWNFSGRYSDLQGFGNLQKGQFITGIPFIDRFYVGTAHRMPDSLPSAGHNRYFLLPLLLGLLGVFAHRKRDRRGFWVVMTIFLMSSLALSLYLNHPMYEPRERDYAYVPSFYAFTIWIGIGAYALLDRLLNKRGKRIDKCPVRTRLIACSVILAAVPLLMAFQNWDDHDRSGRYIARELAVNMLDSCEQDAILFTSGDNATYPLWYIQEVENYRPDVLVVNLSLLSDSSYCKTMCSQLYRKSGKMLERSQWEDYGSHFRMRSIINNYQGKLPIYFTPYAYNEKQKSYVNMFKMHGMVYRLGDSSPDSVDVDASYGLYTEKLKWSNIGDVYIDETSYEFLVQYIESATLVAENLASRGDSDRAVKLLNTMCDNVPLKVVREPWLKHRIAEAYHAAGDIERYYNIKQQAVSDFNEQFEYYNTMPPYMQYFIPYTMEPLYRMQYLLDHGDTVGFSKSEIQVEKLF